MKPLVKLLIRVMIELLGLAEAGAITGGTFAEQNLLTSFTPVWRNKIILVFSKSPVGQLFYRNPLHRILSIWLCCTLIQYAIGSDHYKRSFSIQFLQHLGPRISQGVQLCNERLL